jgi:hypothetical protein
MSGLALNRRDGFAAGVIGRQTAAWPARSRRPVSF